MTNQLLKDITLLASAGFSRDEILTLISPAPAQQTPATIPAPTQVAPTQAVAPTQVVTPTPAAIPAPTQVAPTQVVAPTPVASPVQVPTPAPTPAQPQPATPAVPFLSEDQFTKLIQSVNAGNAGIDIPPKYDLDKVLADHYISIVGGSKKKEE